MTENSNPDILYTIVDEAPELASASFLPIIRKFASAAGVSVGTKDISLAGRIIATFPEGLSEEQRQSDDLAALGELVKTPDANVIKLPNISASVPQLTAAIAELQAQGYDIPNYPEDPQSDAEKAIRARYDTLKGSAVNPVLREGNSDRRSAKAVKNYAQNNPHSMGTWSADSKTKVSSMPGNDFYANEKSATITAAQAGDAKIEFVAKDGSVTVLKDGWSLGEGTVTDATFMSAKALSSFLADAIEDTKADGTMFSLHMKATMMKVSDPIIFGHAVKAWLGPVWDKHGAAIAAAGGSPNSGLGAVLAAIDTLPNAAEIKSEIAALDRPSMYMVDSDKGITNLHVPSDVIIDASMPAVIRAGGKGWDEAGNKGDTNCVIPDNCYATVYDETINYFKENGALDVTKAGSVANVGLMAQKAEEYGSHPTTFEAPADGTIRIVLANGETLHSHDVEAGDIWRACTVNKAPIENWIQLAMDRQRLTGSEAIFWLDANRAHDAELIKYVKPALEAAGVADKFMIMAPREATRQSLDTITAGKDSIAITGNVLRDYLTDLFPILELGTSAKMLSIVKLMNGGGLFETGAGGSAPKHVQQLVEESHLRWDSMGEFCALGESLNFLADAKGNAKAGVLGSAAEVATQGILDNNKSPSRKVGEPDNRDSHYWFARYWAEALAAQTEDADLAAEFKPIAEALASKEEQILAEFAAAQGNPADIGGYYHPDAAKKAAVMRPSATLNAIIG
ncbi:MULTISPECIES: NADP-dependent isocitrate dehydrogenase [Rhodobacterales]|jgi:isocitrate dehydrogenase|uniref:NADP-dependent isocitrate dehydrogenase n=1 Tax=Rhodobacterales TaxID=204455 RepID=UPI00237F238A|nr:NADP-dependent isocitrate dehydrogenase [Phaeobacter gallaeciensis]MDE4099763.1 NADP-dependent isocitrate dehydrogenase [Phaeobacter gallaeciensis]MDE4108502.1 NADP-dependent isocitrate dehydrogenase [Phaeobacter gallaeciensis]MDE4110482.1 NADP-dependent isocitrate dehydrogenase [Phaeobacter gallaeciensis]MDE4117404.1 NADP-dependent isocitrate dehydrogenase [Phaeobacter gallaeciensis]MDE4121878.1 NADP-dependent isocitrate dehydrogenase [Phaeobacter gallaeciensis]